jgi:hypothetical protein
MPLLKLSITQGCILPPRLLSLGGKLLNSHRKSLDVTMDGVFMEYFGFPCLFSFFQLFYIFQSAVWIPTSSLKNQLKRNTVLSRGGSIVLVGFEVHVVVIMKSSTFWDTTPCILLKMNWRFRGMLVKVQGWKMNQVINEHEAYSEQNVVSIFWVRVGLCFDAENGSNM